MSRRHAPGAERAWRWLHDHYFAILHAVAVARGARPADAADLVQRTYLRVLRHARRFHRESDLRAWLCCLLRCEAIDAARAGLRRSRFMEKLHHREALRTATTPPNLDGILDDLPPADRDLIMRHYLHGWSQGELASQHGTSPKAIESRLARLRKRLRLSLEPPNPCSQ
jgi:RNA polymerase sigma-70 factor (ECF subfamily)